MTAKAKNHGAHLQSWNSGGRDKRISMSLRLVCPTEQVPV